MNHKHEPVRMSATDKYGNLMYFFVDHHRLQVFLRNGDEVSPSEFTTDVPGLWIRLEMAATAAAIEEVLMTSSTTLTGWRKFR